MGQISIIHNCCLTRNLSKETCLLKPKKVTKEIDTNIGGQNHFIRFSHLFSLKPPNSREPKEMEKYNKENQLQQKATHKKYFTGHVVTTLESEIN